MLSFLADQCVAFPFIRILRENHCVVQLLKEHLPKESADLLVIKKAQELNLILLTEDGDFGNIIQYPPANYKGIVVIQMKKPDQMPDLQIRLKQLIESYKKSDDYQQKLFVLDPHKIRIRS